VVISDVIHSRYGPSTTPTVSELFPSLQGYMSWLTRQAASTPGPEPKLPQLGLLGDWLAPDPICPGSSDTCLSDPGWTRGNPTTAFQYVLDLQAMVTIP